MGPLPNFAVGFSLSAGQLVGIEISQAALAANADIGTYGFRSVGVPTITCSTGTSCMASLSSVDSDPDRANAETLEIIQVKSNASPTTYPGTIARASGSAGSENGYMCYYNASSKYLTISKVVSGTITPLASFDATSLVTTSLVDFYIRFRVNGTSLKAKMWRYDALEPDWQVSTTDSAIGSAGKVGLYSYCVVANNCDFGTPGFFSVSTNGETAAKPRTDNEIRNWYNNDGKQKVILCSLGVLGSLADGTTANASSVLVSNWPFVTKGNDYAKSQVFDDIITQVPTIKASANEQLVGRSTQTYGDLLVKNEGGVRSHWLQWNWDGRPFEMWIGGVGWRSWDFVKIMTGTIQEVYESGRDQLGFKIRDKSSLLNRKFQTNVFTADANTDASIGEPLPVLFGKGFNIEPRLKKSSSLKYKFHDESLTGSTGIVEVRDQGQALTGGSLPTADIANGEFTLVSSPGGRVTATVHNDLSASSAVKSGKFHKYALQTVIENRVGGGLITYQGGRSGSLANFGDTSLIGLYCREEINVLDLLDEIVISAGGFWYFNSLGLFCSKVLAVPVAPFDHVLIQDDVQINPGLTLEKLWIPSAAQQLGYQRNWTKQSDGFVSAVSVANRAIFAASAQFTAIAPSYSGLEQPSNHLLYERPKNRVTLFYNKADAETEATRVASLYSKPCAIFSFQTKYNAAFFDLGESLQLTHDKFGFSAGRAGIIVGLEKNFGKSSATVKLFTQLDGQFPITTTQAPYVTAEDFY